MFPMEQLLETKEKEIEGLKDIIIKMQEIQIDQLTSDLSGVIGFTQLVFGIVAIIATLSITYMGWTNKKLKKDAENVKYLQARAEQDIKVNSKLVEEIKSNQKQLDQKEDYLIKLTNEMKNILSSGDIEAKLKELDAFMTEYKLSEWEAKINGIQNRLKGFPNRYPINLYQQLLHKYHYLMNECNSVVHDIKNNNLKGINQRLNELEEEVNYFERMANSPHFRED